MDNLFTPLIGHDQAPRRKMTFRQGPQSHVVFVEIKKSSVCSTNDFVVTSRVLNNLQKVIDYYKRFSKSRGNNLDLEPVQNVNTVQLLKFMAGKLPN